MNTTSLVLKQDGLGRVRTPAARREELLAEFARSGLSRARFAALAGVHYQTFMGWVHKQNHLRPGTAVSARRPPRFVEVMAIIYVDDKSPWEFPRALTEKFSWDAEKKAGLQLRDLPKPR